MISLLRYFYVLFSISLSMLLETVFRTYILCPARQLQPFSKELPRSAPFVKLISDLTRTSMRDLRPSLWRDFQETEEFAYASLIYHFADRAWPTRCSLSQTSSAQNFPFEMAISANRKFHVVNRAYRLSFGLYLNRRAAS